MKESFEDINVSTNTITGDLTGTLFQSKDYFHMYKLLLEW